MTTGPLKIGTRGSRLALTQANQLRDALLAAHGADGLGGSPELVIVKTTGDAVTDRPLRTLGGKGLFTKELEEALLAARVDLAVHSVKDMPTKGAPGLALAACLPRVDVRDVLISRDGLSLAGLPPAAIIGTTSLRRQAQILRARPDLVVQDLRGNVETRLARLDEGRLGAIVLARAGLDRLGLTPSGAVALGTAVMLPAVGQGAVGVEIRADNARVAGLLAAINHAPTLSAVTAERAYLARLNGSCQSPIAGHAAFSGDAVSFTGLVLSPDGGAVYGAARDGRAGDAVGLALEVADAIRAAAPKAFCAAYLSGE